MEDTKEVRPDEDILASYMDAEGVDDAVTDNDRKTYWRARYNDVKALYKSLLLQREEIDAMKGDRRDASRAKLVQAFRENREDRIRIVTTLRTMGLPVTDSFVPLSKI